MSAPDTTHCPHCFGATKITPCPHCGWQAPQDNPPPALALGRVLDGRYRIGRVLGHGGFGITYLAWDENLHLRLAIKEYLPRDCASRAPDGISLAIYSGPAGEQFAYGLDRFLEEARALAHFDQHPGIVTVKNFFRAHGTGYCVMDYVDGITLRDYLEQQPGGRIGFDAALKLLMPVMDALRAVHKEGLLHRDIAPDNIYLTQDGRIKLLDFGAARFAAGEHSKSLSVILKPGYAPEEQYRSKGKQGPWTDVYGMAATFYRTTSGAVPPEALDRTEEDELLPPSKFGVSIQPEQEASLLKGLAIKARDRFQSMMELQQALSGGTTTPPTLGEPNGPNRPEKRDIPHSLPKPRAKTTLLLVLGIPLLLILAVVTLIPLPWSETTQPKPPLAGGVMPSITQQSPVETPVTTQAPTPPISALPMATPATNSETIPAEPSVAAAPTVASLTTTPATSAPSQSADTQAEITNPDRMAPNPIASTTAILPASEPEAPQPTAAAETVSPLYYAAVLPPTTNIPPEAPLCYKFMVAGPEEQLRKLKSKYPGLYDYKILTNPNGDKNLVAKRKDEKGKEVLYFYSTSPTACDDYQKNRSQSEEATNQVEMSLAEAQDAYNKDETEKALKIWRRLADVGNAEAQYQIGLAYNTGKGVSKNEVEANRWLSKAAEHGHISSQIQLGMNYLGEDNKKAIKLFEKYADQGNAYAYQWLGNIYNMGRGPSGGVVLADRARALAYFRKAAKLGDLGSQSLLGFWYSNGTGVPKNMTEAARWFLLAAEQGDLESQYLIGEMYEEGNGVTKNLTEAKRWYLKSAEGGESAAQFNLARMYEQGIGTVKNDAEAVKWYLKSASAMPDEIKLKKLAEMHAEGRLGDEEAKVFQNINNHYNLEIKLLEIGFCELCADNVAHFYLTKPKSKCGELAKKALEGNSKAMDELKGFPDYCNIKD